MPIASALTLATKMSMPPSVAAASPTHFFSAEIGDVDRAARGFDALLLERGDGFGDRSGAARAQRDVATFLGELLDDGPADAARAAGDQRLFALEPQIHRRSIPLMADRAGPRACRLQSHGRANNRPRGNRL
jgi:hypothetical protein